MRQKRVVRFKDISGKEKDKVADAVKKVDELEERAKNFKEKTEGYEKEVADLKAKNKALEEEKSNWVSKGHIPSVNSSNANSLEKATMVAFGCSHPKQLIHVNTQSPRFKHVSSEKKDCAMQLKAAVDVSRWTQQLFYNEPFDREPKETKAQNNEETYRFSTVKGVLDNYYAKNELVPRLKAFGSTVANAGDEWVPTAVSTSFIEEFQLDLSVSKVFPHINMPSQPFDMPLQTSKTTARKATENTSFSDTNFSTDKLTLSAVKLQEFYILPEELNEDSAPDFMAIGRADVVNSIHRAQETAIINGDSDGAHQDTDTQAGGADLAEKVWDGLRKIAIANSANGGTSTAAAALTDAFLRGMRKNMGRFGVNPRDLVWFVSAIGYQQMLGLSDVVTVDKMGPLATVLNGALAAYQGIPIVISEFMRDDLNVSGVNDGVTTDNTGVLLVNHRRHWNGTRRPIRMRVMQDLLDQDRVQIAGLGRLAFSSHAQSATEVSAVYGVDVTA